MRAGVSAHYAILAAKLAIFFRSANCFLDKVRALFHISLTGVRHNDAIFSRQGREISNTVGRCMNAACFDAIAAHQQATHHIDTATRQCAIFTARNITGEGHSGRRIATKIIDQARHFAERGSGHGRTAGSKIDIKLFGACFLGRGATGSIFNHIGGLHFRLFLLGKRCRYGRQRLRAVLKFGHRCHGIGGFDHDSGRRHGHGCRRGGLVANGSGSCGLRCRLFPTRFHACRLIIAASGRLLAHFPLVIGLFDGTIGTGGHQAVLFAANFHGRSGNHRRLRCRTMGRLHHRAIVFTTFRGTIGRLRNGVFHRRRGNSASNGRNSTRVQGRRIGNGRLHRRRHLLRTRGSHFSLGLRSGIIITLSLPGSKGAPVS